MSDEPWSPEVTVGDIVTAYRNALGKMQGELIEARLAIAAQSDEIERLRKVAGE